MSLIYLTARSLRLPVSKKSKILCILGVQWGDEGKGKVVDLLGESYQVVARFQGGPNAGHTVKIKGEQFILHHIPSGILHDHTTCVIGNGVVIDPETILAEIDELEERGIDVCGRLLISENAHFILPYHKAMDRVSEAIKEDGAIGTTGRGIGPAYSDKISREGIRVGDLVHDSDWQDRVRENVRIKNIFFEKVYNESPIDPDTVIQLLNVFKDRLGSCITDTVHFLHQAMENNQGILLEGAQGTLLDIDFGTYPFVTSSNTMIAGVFSGLGVDPRSVDQVLGILKAYTTRVGNGPFPTEQEGSFGDKLRELGGEYGATTGRPRRCGWLDCVAAKYAIQINGIDSLCITKMDVLDSLDEIKICTAYKYKGEILPGYPQYAKKLDDVEPVYETVPGWSEPITEARTHEDLPEAARKYLAKLSEILEVPIHIVSVGPGREQTILC